jgi:hypothetical protein
MTNIIEIIENPVTISVDNANIEVSVIDEAVSVEISTTGPQGPTGSAGPSGETMYSDLSYVHTQNSASATWTVNHNLHFIPNVTVVDSAGTVVEGSYSYPNLTTVVLSFSASFSGKAYLS